MQFVIFPKQIQVITHQLFIELVSPFQDPPKSSKHWKGGAKRLPRTPDLWKNGKQLDSLKSPCFHYFWPDVDLRVSAFCDGFRFIQTIGQASLGYVEIYLGDKGYLTSSTCQYKLPKIHISTTWACYIGLG